MHPIGQGVAGGGTDRRWRSRGQSPCLRPTDFGPLVNVLLLLDMVASANPDAVAVQIGTQRMTAAELLSAAWTAANELSGRDAVAYVGTNDLAFPIALFGAAAAEVPFVPLNYRLPESQRAELLRGTAM